MVEGVLGLGGDDGVRLAEQGAALRVAEDGPGDVAVAQLVDRDLTGKGAVGLVVDVLGGDLDLGLEALADQQQVQGRGGDDDVWRKKNTKTRKSIGAQGPGGKQKERESGLPTLVSRLAWFRLSTMALMDLIVPFLHRGKKRPWSAPAMLWLSNKTTQNNNTPRPSSRPRREALQTTHAGLVSPPPAGGRARPRGRRRQEHAHLEVAADEELARHGGQLGARVLWVSREKRGGLSTRGKTLLSELQEELLKEEGRGKPGLAG